MLGKASYHMKPRKIFNDNYALINSLDFHRNGGLLAASSDDSKIYIYNALEPKLLRTIKSDAKFVKYTDRENAVITAPSYKSDNTIRHIDIEENKYLHYYKGHRDSILSLSVDPISPVFISSSSDSTMSFWDFRMSHSMYRVSTGLMPFCSISKDGNKIAIVTHTFDTTKYKWSSNKRTTCKVGTVGFDVTLYDPRMLAKPRDSVTLSLPVNVLGDQMEDCVSMKFSNNGEMILITTNSNSLYIVNANIEREVPAKRLTEAKFVNRGNVLQADFTCDDMFVVCGTDDDNILVWDATSDYSLHHCTDSIKHGRYHSSIIAFNPVYKMMASAGMDLCLWLPPQK